MYERTRLRVQTFTWLRATNEVSCVIPEAMVLSTRWQEERWNRGERGGGRRREDAWGIDVVWQSRCTPPRCTLFASSPPPLPPPPLPKPLFVGSSAHLQRRGWRGWFYWSRLTTPSTPSHHAYAPLLPRRVREGTSAGASAGARHRRPPSHRPYRYYEIFEVARWLIEFDSSSRRSTDSSRGSNG